MLAKGLEIEVADAAIAVEVLNKTLNQLLKKLGGLGLGDLLGA